MRRLVKYKHKDGETLVKYEIPRDEEGTYDTVTLETSDEPRQELVDALQGMASHVCEMIEAPAEWRDELTVLSVKLGYSNDVQGIVITALRALENSNSPLVLNTPNYTREPYNESDISGVGVFTTQCANDIDELEKLVFRFVDGERSQAELDFSDDGIAVGSGDPEPVLQ